MLFHANETNYRLHTAAHDYVTAEQQACAKIASFQELDKEMERPISVAGKSLSTLTNYERQLTHPALHHNHLPTELDKDQVLYKLQLVKSRRPVPFFKSAVYGMHYVFKC
ncbi:hypothetical protein V9K67_23990 [Paraflavisolibacter sp. H34]|uniref:hypothetical protein n=1 Tax=Huijunlia imazamoxiresistens TaxID=3127457 RepID=UPI0030160F8F